MPIPSFTPFTLQNAPTDGGVPLRSLTLSRVGCLGRPQGDVEACRPVSVSLVAALDAFEVLIASPVLFTCMPTPRASLACVAGPNFPNSYALSYSNVFQGVSEGAVGDAVELSGALLTPLTLTFPEVSEPLDGYVG
ncbi:MAG: hypothetical protein QXZ28_04900, partial [Candidatus Methanomethylicaceae archaeon]